MISPVGSVLSVDIDGTPVKVQVISDGPPEWPSSVWAVPYGEGMPGQYILVQRRAGLKSERAEYFGRRKGDGW